MKLPRISDYNRANVECPICGGDGWVCEDHPDNPWQDGDGCCGGAGAPCRCNPLHSDHKEHPGCLAEIRRHRA